jgi:hypothetical protein
MHRIAHLIEALTRFVHKSFIPKHRKSNKQTNKMPFTAAEIVTFFTDAANMGLTLRTATAFAAEGIATPADLAEFD